MFENFPCVFAFHSITRLSTEHKLRKEPKEFEKPSGQRPSRCQRPSWEGPRVEEIIWAKFITLPRRSPIPVGSMFPSVSRRTLGNCLTCFRGSNQIYVFPDQVVSQNKSKADVHHALNIFQKLCPQFSRWSSLFLSAIFHKKKIINHKDREWMDVPVN
jgi:hypothetical protein